MNATTVLTPSISYKPFRYAWAVNTAVEHEKIHWGEWEAKLQEDVNQWKNGSLSVSEKNHIVQILRLFTQSDVEVASNYINCFLPKFKNNEIRAMLISFASREFVHQRAYALLNDTLGLDEHEYYAFLEYEDMKKKIEFMKADLENPTDHHTTAKALAQSACNEGMSLFSAFVMLLNYQRFGKMKGMCEIVEWSIRDESMHVEGMTKLFHEYIHEFRTQIKLKDLYRDIQEMFREAVALEDRIIDISYEMGETEGLSKDAVKEYIRFIANRRLRALGVEPIFDCTKNPIDWLDWVISGDSFKNFFEGTVTDYNADGMKGEWGW
jgi:ribonucleoside-diphosphate reductase beta chain